MSKTHRGKNKLNNSDMMINPDLTQKFNTAISSHSLNSTTSSTKIKSVSFIPILIVGKLIIEMHQ